MYKNSRNKVLIPLLLAVALAVGLIVGQSMGRSTAESQFRRVISHLRPPYDKLNRTMALIQNEYIDSLNMDSITEQVLPLLVQQLDPHSIYIPAKDMQAVNEPLESEFDGIGVVFNMATDTVIVLNVVPSGPSQKAGVQNGDRILRIDNRAVAGQRVPQDSIVKMLRGPRGSQVQLTLERLTIKDTINLTVTRDAIPLKSVDAAFMLSDNIGFIRLSAFAKNSYAEVVRSLLMLRSEGMTKLIFDLRGNTGGFLDQAILIANEFLPEKRMIVYTEDRHKERVEQFSSGTGTATDIALAVLIDEESASSSEILAGALQDNDRGVIIGRRSFGKGLVQQQIPFDDGSALRLTTARYFTPTGRSIQKPYTTGDAKGYEREIYERYAHNEMFSADSIRFDDSLRYITPAGRTVYGGGGIMPDRFIPMDTTDMTRYYIEVVGRNILYRYTIEYGDRHRDALNKVQTTADLRALLDADRTLLNDFVAYAARKGVRPAWSDIRRSRKLLEAQIRAFIGRNTALEDAGYYSEIHAVDTVVAAAIEELENMDNSLEPKTIEQDEN
ncbi:MAG: S41 family peptidase [Rikenellaceae bacterium]|nr:S41 family peptidase [Rikenellaceae bacterium]